MPRSWLIALAGLSLLPSIARAGALYSETFDAAGFKGAYIANQSDERSSSTPYYYASNFNGWLFSGTAFYSVVGGDGAITLNEAPSPASATKTVTALIPNYMYQLSFDLTGDNIPNALSELRVSVNAAQVLDMLHSWTVVDSGAHVTVYFTSSTSSALINFAQVDRGDSASPAINNVMVVAVPEPASAALLGAGFAAVAVWRRRSRA